MSLVKFTCYSHLFVYFHPFFSDEGSQQSLSLVQECVVRNTKAVEPWGVQRPLNHEEYEGHWTMWSTKATEPWGVWRPLNHVEYKGRWTTQPGFIVCAFYVLGIRQLCTMWMIMYMFKLLSPFSLACDVVFYSFSCKFLQLLVFDVLMVVTVVLHQLNVPVKLSALSLLAWSLLDCQPDPC